MKLDAERNSWLKIRKDLFRQVQAQVMSRLGKETDELKSYRMSYEKEFDRKWVVSDKVQLIDSVLESDIVFMGDFHASQQSQRAMLRVLQSIGQKRSVVLGVEFIETQDQLHLDQYLSGQLSEDKFLKKIKWNEKWGFPWDHYSILLKWAIENEVPVYALNKNFVQKKDVLKKRDRFSGARIDQIVENHPNSLVVIFYGDLHLTESHLLSQVKAVQKSRSPKRVLRILQNSEKIYFQLAARGIESEVNVVRLSQDCFCLMSVPPWVKWQNYLMYLEKNYDLEIEDVEERLDYTDLVARYVDLISNDLGLNISKASLSVYTAEDTSFWHQLNETMLPRELKIIRQLISDEWSFYLPEKAMSYLARPSVNHAANLAMEYIHSQTSKREKNFLQMPQHFLQLIWIQAVSYYGSKIVNHSRKTDTLQDIKIALASKFPGDLGKEAMLVALAQKMKEWMILHNRQSSQDYQPKREASYREAARILGGILGEKMYAGYRLGHLKKTTLNHWMSSKVESSQFSVFYYEVIEVVDSLPVFFESKSERL